LQTLLKFSYYCLVIEFKIIAAKDINTIIPLIKLINTTTPLEKLRERFAEMCTQNYECHGVYHDQVLIGCLGMWFQTRHYSGKSVELDHVVIHPDYRGKTIGEKMMDYCNRYARDKGFEVLELNCYLQNEAGHRFWDKVGYQKLGYHHVLKL
jgi:ribosomal protein S18 acetylase RimI-like enzyme